MLRLAYYVSDHGYGHAARSVAAIRAILSRIADVQVVVKASGPLPFLQRSLADPRVGFDARRNDFGLLLRPRSFKVDQEATARAVGLWVGGWPQWLEEETAFWQGQQPAIILSDIAPQPFLLAHRLGVPGIAISNFTWHEMYTGVLGHRPELQLIEAAYQMADRVLVPQVGGPLPFPCYEEIGWLVRKSGQGRAAIRQSLGIGEEETLAYVGFGRAIAGMEGAVVSRHLPFRVLLPECVDGPAGAVYLPSDCTESQDYLAACDLVMSKAGYSTIAEALAGQVPMLLVRRDEVPEDRRSLAWVEQCGLGEALEEEALLDGRWIAQATGMLESRGQYQKAYRAAHLDMNGASAVAEAVLASLAPAKAQGVR